MYQYSLTNGDSQIVGIQDGCHKFSLLRHLKDVYTYVLFYFLDTGNRQAPTKIADILTVCMYVGRFPYILKLILGFEIYGSPGPDAPRKSGQAPKLQNKGAHGAPSNLSFADF